MLEASFNTTVGEILLNIMNHDGVNLFDSVVPHGTRPNAIILAGLQRNAGIMHKAKYHLLSLVQDPFPGINHSDLFLTVISDNVIDKNYHETKVMSTMQIESQTAGDAPLPLLVLANGSFFSLPL